MYYFGKYFEGWVYICLDRKVDISVLNILLSFLLRICIIYEKVR